ncbi:MAG: hypothetical protein ACM3U1_08930 [Chloroflexota bacterium]
MRFSKYLTMAVLLAAAGFFSACSDDKNDPNKPGDNANYYPYETVGSYWVYESSVIDTAGAKSDQTVDSMYVAKKENYEGKMAAFIDSYSDGEYAGTQMKLNVAGAILNAYSDMLLPVDSEGIPTDSIPKMWVTIANSGGTEWTVIPVTQLPEVPFDMGVVQGKIKLTYNATEKKVGQENMTYQGATVKTWKYTVTNHIQGNLTITGIPTAIPLNFDVKMHVWFGENIGLMRQHVEPTVIDLGPFGKTASDGSEQILIRHNIKK